MCPGIFVVDFEIDWLDYFKTFSMSIIITYYVFNK